VPVFRECVREILAALEDSEIGRLERLEAAVAGWREEAAIPKTSKRKGWPLEDRQRLLAALCVLSDLARQGWLMELAVRGPRVTLTRPPEQANDPVAEKNRIRRQELMKRKEQLSKPAVRDFVRAMEVKRVYRSRFVSILSLARDGRELGAALRAANELPPAERATRLDGLIQPYLQFVDDVTRCELTGFRLMDIWRYFRHTWANQYLSVPGRTMQFLVRDRAAPLHPIIGICALSSPIVQIRARDLWIGWHPERFLETIRAAPTYRVARWLVQTVDRALDDVYTQDFLEDGTLSLAQLLKPSQAVIDKLRELAARDRDEHHRYTGSKEQKQAAKAATGDWTARAESLLFRSKRALALADLLEVRSVLRRFFGERPTKAKLSKLLEDPTGDRVIGRILRKAKADRVGIVMADISVCGALPPYSALLGGKLVAMLATSPEVVQEYRRRYGSAVSEIASATAGRPITRSPDLVFLATTSLYGSSSQYNRIAIPCDRLGGQHGTLIRYQETGRSEAFGTSHFSEETVDALVTLVSQRENGVRVNSIFGEGQSPKFRKIREGIEELGFLSQSLLRHGRHRVIYCIPLIRNVRDFMVGLDRKPDYLVPQEEPVAKTAAIAQWWRERWLLQRATRQESIDAVEAHNLIYPVRHGARVALPADSQRELFD